MEAGQFFWENRPLPQLLTEASLHIYFLQSYLALDKRKWYLLVYRWTMDIFLDGEYIKIKHISITCSLCINKMSKTSRMHRKKKKDRKRKIRQHPIYTEGIPKTTSTVKKMHTRCHCRIKHHRFSLLEKDHVPKSKAFNKVIVMHNHGYSNIITSWVRALYLQ